MPWPVVAAFACPLLLSLTLTALLIRWSPRLGLVDLPGARKVHTTPTPRGGGLAIYLAVVVGALVLPDVRTVPLLTLFAVGLGIVILGLVDDLRPLPWQLRLGIQFLLAGVLLYLRADPWGWGVRAVAVVWLVAMVNAFNMLDNMDALSGGTARVAAVFTGLTLLLRQGEAWDWAPAYPYLLLTGALSGFLWFNRPPARIFMGDAGSTFLGLFLGAGGLDVALPAEPQGLWSWAVPLCLLAVPCYDQAAVVLLRLWQGRSPFHADKQHVSHRLVGLGLGSPTAVRTIHLFGVASGLTGVVLDHVPGWAGALLLGQFVCWWVGVAAIEYFPWFSKRPE